MIAKIAMTLDQLDSILNWAFNNGNHQLLPAAIAELNPEWNYLVVWFNELNSYIINGRRDLLNTELPKDFIQAVLSKVDKYCYLSKKDGHLRSCKFKPDDEPLSYLECFNRYGGMVLEDTLEKGSYRVDGIKQ